MKIEKINKGKTGIKFVMAVQPKIPRILHNLFKRSAQICPNIWDIIIQSPCWVSVIRDQGGGSSKDAHTFFCRTYMHTCV